jgi:hypothetical protein
LSSTVREDVPERGRTSGRAAGGVTFALALTALVLLGAAVAYQTYAVARSGAARIANRNDPTMARSVTAVVRQIPRGARFAVTAPLGGTYARYELYPRAPVRVRFTGKTEDELARVLADARVEYVLVTPRDVPSPLRGRRPWYRVAARSGDPPTRLLRIRG